MDSSEISHLKRVLRKNKKMYTPVVKERIERLEEILKSFQSFLDATSHPIDERMKTCGGRCFT